MEAVSWHFTCRAGLDLNMQNVINLNPTIKSNSHISKHLATVRRRNFHLTETLEQIPAQKQTSDTTGQVQSVTYDPCTQVFTFILSQQF